MNKKTKSIIQFTSLLILASSLTIKDSFSKSNNDNTEKIVINAKDNSKPFPHFWEKIFGSGRAVLSLRESYRNDLKKVKKVTDLQYVRPHGIFHDEIGIYDEDSNGKPIYNFSYVDQIYDGLLEQGVKPFVELSFMPRKLASKPIEHPFWYKQITAPPKDWQRWEDLIYAFTKHLVTRYGEAEVSKWYFEVWNEPNIDFWSGEPKEESYYELYDRTARTIKKVNPNFLIGGPGTAQAAWVDRFIQHCVEKKVPVDFVTTHVYANDSAKDVFGTDENIPRETMVFRSVKKVYEQVKNSKMPKLPIIWSEYNASYKNEVNVTDSPYMGPWLANNIRQCDGMTTFMSYWDFSDVFEEQGIVKTPFYGGFGLMAAGNIPKASYNVFKLLHKLGTQRIPNASNSTLVTKRDDGSLAIALWNYFEPEKVGKTKQISLVIKGSKGFKKIAIYQLDKNHGSALTLWEKMGKPAFPSIEQQKRLREGGELSKPTIKALSLNKDLNLTLTLPAHSLFLIEELK